MFQVRTQIVNGRNRVFITRGVSGVDKKKEVVLKIMGDNYEFDEKEPKEG